MRFLNYENYEDHWKNGLFFWWRHNRSRWRHNILIFNGSRDLGLIFQKKKFLGRLDQPAACWISYKTPYFSDFNLGKNPHLRKKITNQTSFPTKSTTLNPMGKSDLVTYRGATIGFLFFSVAISGTNEKSNTFWYRRILRLDTKNFPMSRL